MECGDHLGAEVRTEILCCHRTESEYSPWVFKWLLLLLTLVWLLNATCFLLILLCFTLILYPRKGGLDGVAPPLAGALESMGGEGPCLGVLWSSSLCLFF